MTDASGGLLYGRLGSSFSGYATSSSLLGLPDSSTSARQYGSYYALNGIPDYATERASGTAATVYLGSSYTVSVFSLDTFFAGQEYYNRAAVMLTTSDTEMQKLRDRPYAYNFASKPLYFSSTITGDYYTKLPIFSNSSFTSRYAFPIGFAPSRPLLSTPTLIEEERVNQLVSISGARSYRISYARRRIYEIKLLLDGACSPSGSKIFDPLTLWGEFLRWADAGVTLWIDRDWLSCFWRPARSVVCPNMPNEISGTLLDASSLAFAPREGIPDAYEVTLRIADETGRIGYVNGEVPER